MKRIYLSLCLLAALIGGSAIAYNIKDTANPVGIYTGSNATPTINAATNGVVTLGPTAGLTALSHSVNGSIVDNAQSGIGAISSAGSMNLMANLYYDSAGTRGVANATGYTQARVLRSSTANGEVFQLFSNYIDAQTANGSAIVTNDTKIMAGSAAGNWNFGPPTATAANGHGFTGYVKVEGNTSSPYPIYIGRSSTNYPIIGANAAPTTTSLTVSRQVTDTSSVIAFGNSTAGAGTAFEFHGFSNGGAGNLTLSTSSLIASAGASGQWVFGPSGMNGVHTMNGSLIVGGNGTDKANFGTIGANVAVKAVTAGGTLLVTTEGNLGTSTGMLIIRDATSGKGCLVFNSANSSAGVTILADGDAVPCVKTSGSNDLLITSNGVSVTITNQFGVSHNIAAMFYGI